ncbi:CcmD family protein [Novibacillus thermophilus]
MGYLFAGTAIVWIGILAYVISISVRQRKVFRLMQKLKRNS